MRESLTTKPLYIYIYIYRCSWYKHAHKCLYFFIVIESDTCTTDESCWLSLESLQTVFLWLCFFLLESMERSRNSLITHVHVRYDLWFHLLNRLCCRNDSKSVHISVLRSVCLIMCLWLSLWMFWSCCVVNKIQIIKKMPPLRKDLLTQRRGALWRPRLDLWKLHVWSLDGTRRF